MRTISIGDVQTGRGAPNIDGAAPWIAYRLFKRCGDRMPLGDILGCGDFVPRLHSVPASRSEEHTSELQSLMRISYAVFCLKKKNKLEQLILSVSTQMILT